MKKIGLVGGTGPESTVGAEDVSLTAITMHMVFAELVYSINRMKKDDGIEGIILGCTELPLILNSSNCPVKSFDAVDIHLKKLISLAME